MTLATLPALSPRIPMALRRRHLHAAFTATAQLLLAVALTLVTPLLMTSLPLTFPFWLGWLASYFLLFVGLYAWEWRSRRRYFRQKWQELETDSESWYRHVLCIAGAGWKGWEPGGLRAACLFIPRQWFAGVTRLRSHFAARQVDLERAAQILQTLLSREGWIAVRQLARHGESAAHFEHALAFLLIYGWIGASEHGLRVWALDTTRTLLGPSCAPASH